MALTPVSEQQKREVQEIEKRFRDMLYTPSKFTDKELDGIRKKYDTYKITYKMGRLPAYLFLWSGRRRLMNV